jgi:hypothetical protein
VLVTDKLRSYGPAKSEIGLSARHDHGLRANNRAENSHQPTRRRERKMQCFNRPDRPNASCPFTPPPKTLSTSSAISHYAARSAPSEKELFALCSGMTEPRRGLVWIRRSPLRIHLRQPQNDLAVALVRAPHLAELMDELSIKPNADHTVPACGRILCLWPQHLKRLIRGRRDGNRDHGSKRANGSAVPALIRPLLAKG